MERSLNCSRLRLTTKTAKSKIFPKRKLPSVVIYQEVFIMARDAPNGKQPIVLS